MRRWTGFLAGLSLLALVGMGCHHTAGICDCCNGCGGGYPPVGPGPVVGAAPSAPPVMPYAPTSYPTSVSTLNDVYEGDTVVPVTIHMPKPVVHHDN